MQTYVGFYHYVLVNELNCSRYSSVVHVCNMLALCDAAHCLLIRYYVGLCSESRDKRLVQSLQLALLFLPPANRRILHMLLKLLNKTASNTELILDPEISNKKLVCNSHTFS